MHSVIMMLRDSRITINFNGFLYNLSLEPFLLAILQDSNYLGYTMKLNEELITLDTPNTSVNVKFLCYADDILVFLQNLNDLNQL